jgi:hypothetical protein
VWKTLVLAGQKVIHRWSRCGQPGYKPRPASTVADPTAVVHRCPPAIHRLSTGFVPCPGDNVGTLPARRPQNLQQEIHTPPQGVGRNVTLGACPHRFPQGLSTSVRSAARACPPLGITSCVRPVDNVGTTGLSSRVCERGRGHGRGRVRRVAGDPAAVALAAVVPGAVAGGSPLASGRGFGASAVKGRPHSRTGPAEDRPVLLEDLGALSGFEPASAPPRLVHGGRVMAVGRWALIMSGFLLRLARLP